MIGRVGAMIFNIFFFKLKKYKYYHLLIFISRHTIVARYYGFTLVVSVSVHLSVIRPSVFSFPDDNLSKCQWNFAKLGMCIDIVDIWFRIADGQISSIFDRVICPRHARSFVSGR